MEETAGPEYILLPKRAIETVLCFQEIDFGEVGRLARALQFGDVGRKVSPGGRLMIVKITILIAISVGIMIRMRCTI